HNPTGVVRRLGLHRLRKTLDRYLFFPSPHILFVLTARRKLLTIIAADLAKGKQVCLLTCAPPHGIGLIGLYIKHKFPQVHWIIDWQDLWSYDENYYYITPKPYRNRLKKWEQRMLQTADMNITTNAYAKAVLEDHYDVPPNRTSFIHHHFDREDAEDEHNNTQAQAIANDGNVIKLGFLGTLFKPPRVPGGDLAEALTQVRASGSDVELHVHGLLPQDFEQSRERLRQAGVIMHGPSSHEEAVKKLAQYDFLLLLLANLPNCKVVMSIKLPHYLMMGKPILAIVPERSAIADIITQTGAGIVVPTHSDWSKELLNIFRNDKQIGAIPTRNESVIQQFDWENVSAHWLELFAKAALSVKSKNSSATKTA
ncbi:MAG: glycosyltransferase, partial [Pseudomonadales bacterium]